MNARKSLFFAAVFTELTGLLVVVGALLPAALAPFYALVFGEAVAISDAARLGIGIAGALMVGWGAMLAMLVRSLDALTPHALGTATAVGVVSWFVLDGIVSLAVGAALNVVGNTVYLVILLAPALALRSGARVPGTA